MRRVSLFVLVLALAMPLGAWAQGKPDFSGTWTLDTAKSDPAPQGRGGGGGGSQTIKQTAAELSVTTEGRNGPQTLTYKLDGSESQNPGRGGAMVKSMAKWDGAKLVISTTVDMGGTPATNTQARSLSADGKEMTIEATNQTANGEVKRKTVYTKS